MKQRSRSVRFASLGIFAAASLAASTPARAEHIVVVTGSAGGALVVQDNLAGDLDPTVGVISVSPAALTAQFPSYLFSSLTSASTPTGVLTQGGTVTRLSGTSPNTLSISDYDTDFAAPAGNPKGVGTTASVIITSSTLGATSSFQSYFDPTNDTPHLSLPSLPSGIALPLLTFTASTPAYSASDGMITPIGTQPTPYTLRNTTSITLLANGSTETFFGSAQVSAADTPTGVPLPSIAGAGVCLLGGLAGVGRARRKPPAR